MTMHGLNSNIRGGIMAGNVMSQVSLGTGFTFSWDKFDVDSRSFLPAAALESDPKQISPSFRTFAKSIDSPESTNLQNELAKVKSDWTRFHTVYFFGDMEGRYIFNSHFIEGTDVKLTPAVFDAKAGIAWKFSGLDATVRFTRLVRSSEFNYPAGNAAPSQRFTQLSMEWNWGAVKNPYATKPLASDDGRNGR